MRRSHCENGMTSPVQMGRKNQVAATTAALNVWTLGDLTLSSALSGGNTPSRRARSLQVSLAS